MPLYDGEREKWGQTIARESGINTSTVHMWQVQSTKVRFLMVNTEI